MAYDGAGSRTTLTASVPGAPTSYSGTTGYQYDYNQTANPALNRSQLTKETSTRGSYTNVFSYDGGTSVGPGNPTSFKGTSQTFNADNQQTGTGFAYDGAGNPTTYKTKALTFDPENRPDLLRWNYADERLLWGRLAGVETGGQHTHVLPV